MDKSEHSQGRRLGVLCVCILLVLTLILSTAPSFSATQKPARVKVQSLSSKQEATIIIKWKKIKCDGYRLQYSTDKNSGSKIFKGNTTKYFINEVPTPANKYDAWVKENIDPERLRLTGDPAFFPSMPWQDQRKWLLQVSGDVTDADVIAADPGLKQMEEMLGKHSVEDIKAMAAAKLKLANKTVKEDMIRIDQTVKMAGNVQESVLAEQIARLYVTHPGVTAEGIMTKMELGRR